MYRKASFLLVVCIALLGISGSLIAQDAQITTAECGSEGYSGNWQSLEVIDPMTVKITLCAPDPAFPSKIAFEGFPINPSEYVEATGGTGDILNNPIGTGPYQLAEWIQGDQIVLSRNDSYWGELAKEPTAIINWNSEATQRLTELQAGSVDGISNVGTGDFEIVQTNPDLALLPGAITNVLYLGFNNTIAPMDNVMVRQAIAHAIDKDRIVANFYPAGSIVATQFMPPVLFGFTPEVEPLAYDLAVARQLLDEAGFPASGDPLCQAAAGEEPCDGLRFELPLNFRIEVRGYIPDPPTIATDFQAQLAKVGIKANVEPIESTTFLDGAAAGQYPLFLLGWGMDYPDATNFLDFHFGTGSNASFGDEIPEIYEPLAAAAQLGSPDDRYPLYVEANTALRDITPMVPIAHGASGNAWKASIEGAYVAQVGVTMLSRMEDPADDNIIFMQNGEPGSLYCNDETDGELLMACGQITEPLMNYNPDTGEVIPWLAEVMDVNETATEYTFHLREGVTFHDGSALDATDVYVSLLLAWDASHPLHVGRSGTFDYFSSFFGGFLNPPAAE